MSGKRLDATNASGSVSSSSLIALYDGQCNLCLATMDKLRKLDSQEPVEWVSIQAYQRGEYRALPALTNVPAEQLMAQMHVIDSSGRLYSGSEGVMRLLRNVRSLRWIGAIGEWPGFRGISRLIYKLVARNRYRLFGKNDSCADGVCSLPQSKTKGGGKPS
jgi:Uncharacterized protein conserved in bacteria